VDGPPFVVTDATILASKVDGVLIVLRLGKTTRISAQQTIENFKRTGANIVGIVLNRIEAGYGARLQYYASENKYTEY